MFEYKNNNSKCQLGYIGKPGWNDSLGHASFPYRASQGRESIKKNSPTTFITAVVEILFSKHGESVLGL